jgi:hypothetical protein
MAGAPLPQCRVGVIVALDSDRCVSEPDTHPSLADAVRSSSGGLDGDARRLAISCGLPSPSCVDESEIARRVGGSDAVE